MTRFRSNRTWVFGSLFLALVAALALAPGAGAIDTQRLQIAQHRPNPAAQLTVLTYNIKGLPWPVAGDRTPELEAIGATLRELRSHGNQPRVVLLQEAFSSEAKNIAKVAGYRNVVFGPSEAPKRSEPPLGEAYAKAAQWTRGEFGGSLADSGLAVLSDFPIAKVVRVAFPQGACAGLDCLASKGVLLAWIKVPGISAPVLLGNTHLNSRHASKVAAARSDAAYAWQARDLGSIVAEAAKADTPMIIGGDFNIGDKADRIAAFRQGGLLGVERRDDLAQVRRNSLDNPGAAEIPDILANNKVKLFSRKGGRVQVEPLEAWVPFPWLTELRPLSDHAGLIVEYRVTENS